MKDKYLELMHQELDGVNSPEESAELQAYLSADPDARKRYEEIAALSEKLNRVPMAEAPADLTSRVMGTIASLERRPAASGVRTRAFSFLEDLRELKWRYAISFSLGLAMGCLLLFLLMDKTDDTAYLRGVMGFKGDFSRFVTVEDTDIALPEITGRVTVASTPDILRVELTLHAAKAMDVRVGYDPSALSFYGFRVLESSDSCRIALQPGAIGLTHQGDHRYLLVFRGMPDEASPLQLEILEDHTLLLARTLKTAGTR